MLTFTDKALPLSKSSTLTCLPLFCLRCSHHLGLNSPLLHWQRISPTHWLDFGRPCEAPENPDLASAQLALILVAEKKL